MRGYLSTIAGFWATRVIVLAISGTAEAGIWRIESLEFGCASSGTVGQYEKLQELPRTISESQNFSSLMERARSEYRDGRFAQAEILLTTALRSGSSVDEIQRARALSEMGDVLVN